MQTSSSTNTTSPNSTITSETAKTTSSSPPPTNAGANSLPANSDTIEGGETVEQITNSTEIESKSKGNKGVDEEEEDDYHNDGDKLWEDVDKDLGDILREVEPGKSSDDEDSRYDRFKNSEKKAQLLRDNKEKANNDAVDIEKTKKLDTIKVKTEDAEK